MNLSAGTGFYQSIFCWVRNSCLHMFFTIGVLKNFETGKHLFWRLQHRCFPVKFAKFLKTPFLQNICGGFFCWVNEELRYQELLLIQFLSYIFGKKCFLRLNNIVCLATSFGKQYGLQTQKPGKSLFRSIKRLDFSYPKMMGSVL